MVSNAKGNFKLLLDRSPIIVFSFLTFHSTVERLKIQNRDNIDFTLTALSGYHLKRKMVCTVHYTV